MTNLEQWRCQQASLGYARAAFDNAAIAFQHASECLAAEAAGRMDECDVAAACGRAAARNARDWASAAAAIHPTSPHITSTTMAAHAATSAFYEVAPRQPNHSRSRSRAAAACDEPSADLMAHIRSPSDSQL